MSDPKTNSDTSGSPVVDGIVRLVYQLAFTFLLIIASPFLLIKMIRRGQWKEGFGQRFGIYDRAPLSGLNGPKTIWLNAVSVGEVNLTAQLVVLLREKLPGATLVVTTTTTTGMVELQRKLPDEVIKLYYPLDQQSIVRRAIRTINPRAIILIEADYWPNLLWEARAQGIPVLLVNALLSERSARLYRKAGFMFRPLFATFDRVFCSDQSDADRLESLGVQTTAIEVVGHPKFDTARAPDPGLLDVRRILHLAGVPDDATILLGGSTHSGEESILARTFLNLRLAFPELFLVLVPRHFERAGEVARQIRGLGIEVTLRTDLPDQPPPPSSAPRCLIVNTTGELRSFYLEAELVFVGESFVEGGGQNPIEPAVCGCAITTGPKMETFRTILPRFLEADAIIQVRDPEELESVLARLLEDPTRRKEMGRRARRVVEVNRGALQRTADGIVSRLSMPREHRSPPVI